MKISRTIICIAAISAALNIAGCRNHEEKTMTEIDPMDGPVVEMITTRGAIKIKLYNATPKHRDNFLKLTKEHFYDGTKFHRVIPGFMIQGGDPLSKDDSISAKWGTGGPGYTIPAEIVDTLKHRKGAVAAARLGDMANPRRVSSGSQFYIVQSEEGCAHLDGQYTVFGQVIEGLEVIDLICAIPTDIYDRPFISMVINSVREVEVVDTVATADSTKAPDTVAPSENLSRDQALEQILKARQSAEESGK